MGIVIQAGTSSTEAPDLGEGGLMAGTFVGLKATVAKGGKYQKNPEGDPKLLWLFTIDGEDGEPLREDRDEHPNFNQPIILEKMTGTGFNINATTVPAEIKVLKALATPAEFAAFEAGEGVDEEALKGRKAMLEVIVKDNGWPTVGNVIKKGAKKAADK